MKIPENINTMCLNLFIILPLSLQESIFLSLEEAQRVIVVTWLLRDPEANKLNLRITEFENWPWSDWPQEGRENLIKKLYRKLKFIRSKVLVN